MKCPRCHAGFKFIQIPLGNRVIEAGSTRFVCPCDRVWLKPRRKFAYLSVLGLLGMAIPTVISGFGPLFGFHADSNTYLIFSILVFAGAILLLFGFFTIELKVVGEVEETQESE